MNTSLPAHSSTLSFHSLFPLLFLTSPSKHFWAFSASRKDLTSCSSFPVPHLRIRRTLKVPSSGLKSSGPFLLGGTFLSPFASSLPPLSSAAASFSFLLSIFSHPFWSRNLQTFADTPQLLKIISQSSCLGSRVSLTLFTSTIMVSHLSLLPRCSTTSLASSSSVPPFSSASPFSFLTFVTKKSLSLMNLTAPSLAKILSALQETSWPLLPSASPTM
mmetsp:Transcript_4228/g.8012  ORF Transcript_4228/g.8012 Transcript_4228/m.8012 type:complete len:217 (-) Transcript_4228:846-1496(-)